MSADQANHNEITGPTCMESVNRISKLPAVETTIQTATNIYGKVKEFNGLTNWTLSTAESTVQKAVEVGKPITTPVLNRFEGPIKTVDDYLCKGLNYVEEKVPAVKLPPGEILLQIYNTTKDLVTPAVETAYAYAGQAKEIVEPRLKQARDLVEPVMQTAYNAVEPAIAAAEATRNMVTPTVEAAKNIVEPLIQPAVDKANQLKEMGMQKVDEYLHRGHNPEGCAIECQECEEVRESLEKNKPKSE